MEEAPLHILVVVGSLNHSSATRVVMNWVADELRREDVRVDVLDLGFEPLALFNPETSRQTKEFLALRPRVEAADVYLLGTPDYHGSISSALKNFLDHFWHEFAGKLFATVVASHEKGLTVTDQLRTVARQCYAWSLPYGISFADKADLKEGQLGEDLRKRIRMLTEDVKIYGSLLARQRRADLAGTNPGFLARLRRAAAGHGQS